MCPRSLCVPMRPCFTHDRRCCAAQEMPKLDKGIQKDSSYLDYMLWVAKHEELMKKKIASRGKVIAWKKPSKKVRQIRPFLSSTFRDFNKERNLFFKDSVPKLSKMCQGRGVQFAPLDLRWGVTKEESSTGEVIRLCNFEIDRCRPYFVCSLGFRNGWCLNPDNGYDDTLLKKTFEIAFEHYPWVKDLKDRSVTEIEIQHGALRKPHCRCFFYFRSYEYLQQLDESERKVYIDKGLNALKLVRLKNAIIDAGFKIRWFKTAKEMVDLLHEDMKDLIERDCSQEFGQRKRHIRERNTHRVFRQQNTHLYIDPGKYISFLKKVLADGKQMYVLGEDGCGKSALIANFVETMLNQKARQEDIGAFTRKSTFKLTQSQNMTMSGPHAKLDWAAVNIIERYIECSSLSDSGRMLHMINMEIQDLYQTELKLDYSTSREQFADLLNLVSERAYMYGPLLLVLDGLDHMTGTNDYVLSWLPVQMPKGVALLASCSEMRDSKLSSPTYKSLRKRPKQMTLRIKRLSKKNTTGLTTKYLEIFGKKVDQNQLSIILDNKNSALPLFLVTLLDEIRVFGDFFGVTGRIEQLLEPVDSKTHPVSGLFQKVLARMEEDYDKHMKGLTRCVAACLLLSNSGLTEQEVREITELELRKTEGVIHSTKKKLDIFEFRALFLRMEGFLIADSFERFSFKNTYFRHAVQERYKVSPKLLEKQAMLRPVHRLLAKYFASSNNPRRRAEELPHHLKEIAQNTPVGSKGYVESTEALRKCLLKLETFRQMCTGSNAYTLHKYWQLVERRSTRKTKLSEVLMKSLEAEEHRMSVAHEEKTFSGTLNITVQLATERSVYNITAQVGEVQMENTSEAISETTLCYYFDLDLANVPMDERLQLHLHGDDTISFSLSQVLNPGATLESRGVCVSSRREEIAEMYLSVGSFLVKTRPWSRPEKMLEKAIKLLALCPFERARRVTVETLMTLSTQYQKQGELNKALPPTLKSIKICGQLDGAEDTMFQCRSNLAMIQMEQGAYRESANEYEKLLTDLKQVGKEDPVTAQVMSNYANLLMLQGNHEKAHDYLEKAQSLMIHHRGVDSDSTARVRASLAACLVEQGDFSKAQRMYEKIKTSKAKLYGDNHQELVVVFNGMATAKFKQLQLQDAEAKKKTGGSTKALHKSSDFAEVISNLKRSLVILERCYGAEDQMLVPTLNNLVTVYARTDVKMCKSPAENILRILKLYGREESPQAESAHLALARNAHMEEDIKAEVDHYRKVERIRENRYGPGSPQVKLVVEKLGPIAEAAAMVEELEGKIKALEEGSEAWARAMYDFAENLYGSDMLHRAQEIAEKGFERYGKDPHVDALAGDLDDLLHTIMEIVADDGS